jgi:hypothetical protein
VHPDELDMVIGFKGCYFVLEGSHHILKLLLLHTQGFEAVGPIRART